MSDAHPATPPTWKAALMFLAGAGLSVAGYFLAVDPGQRGTVSLVAAQLLFFGGAAIALIACPLIITTYIRRHKSDDAATRQRAIRRNQTRLGPLAVAGGVIGTIAHGASGAFILGIAAGGMAYLDGRAFRAFVRAKRRPLA